MSGRATPRWWADAAGAAAWASVLASVAMWVGGRGLQDMGGPWTAVSSIGRLTALVGTDLMIVMVIMMARIPAIERSFGQDHLARWHRLIGFTSVNMIVAHVLLSTLGQAGAASRFASQLWSLIEDGPGVLLSVGGLVAIGIVAVTSVRAARRKLRYESWHLLHLYAYLGLWLALPHQLWIGSDLTSSKIGTAYWWALYLLATGSTLVFRIGLPILRSRRHQVTVESVTPEADGVVSITMRGRALDRLPVRGGQFFQWRFHPGEGWSRAHPYSLSAAPTADRWRITVKAAGDGSARDSRIRPGAKVWFEGPYGRLTSERYRGGGVTMFGCGIGVTPLRAMIEELPVRPGQATLVYRARDTAELYLRQELETLATQRGIRIVYLTGPRAQRPSWLPASAAHLPDDAAMVKLVPEIKDHDVYICGPGPWAAAVKNAASSVGVPDKHIHAEGFAW